MNLEAVEVFTALKQTCRVGDLLREKLSEDWKTESFQTFLFAHYLPKLSIKEPFNKVSESLYKDRMAALVPSLFPGSAKKTSPDKGWRAPFKKD